MLACDAPMKEFFATRLMRRIMICMMLTEFLWGFGNFFVLLTNTLPTYLLSLGASPIIIGTLVIAMMSLGLIPQVFGRTVLDRFRRRKRAIILLHMICITPYLLIPIAHSFLASRFPSAQIGLTIGLLAVSQLALALVVPVWMDMQAHVIPLHLRGRYYGLTVLFFAGGGILSGIGLSRLPGLLGPQMYQGMFFIATIFFLLAMCAFSLAPIPAAAFEHPAEPSVWSRIAKSARACHPRTDFGRLVISNAVLTLSIAITPFLIVYAVDARHGLRYAAADIIGWATVCLAIGSAGGGLLLGWLVDRLGPRVPWMALTALIPMVLLLISHGHHLPVLVLAFLFAGMLNMPWSVTLPAMLEYSPPGDKSGYIAIANVISLLPAVFGALFIGYSINAWGYPVAFMVAGASGIVSFLLGMTLRTRSAPRSAAPTPEQPIADHF